MNMTLQRLMKICCLLIGSLMCSLALSGCLVAGVSSNGGFFVWPGSISLLVLVFVLIFFLRRR